MTSAGHDRTTWLREQHDRKVDLFTDVVTNKLLAPFRRYTSGTGTPENIAKALQEHRETLIS